jgi:predicted PurR-regulated permease PerM
LVAPESSWQRLSAALATLGLVALAIGFLYWASPVLIPTAFAILLAFMLSPVVRMLQQWSVPRLPAVLVVVTVAGLLLSLLAWLFVAQTLQLANQLPAYQENVTRRIAEFKEQNRNSVWTKVQSFVNRVTEEATGSDQPRITATGEVPQPVQIVPHSDTWIAPLFFGLGPLIEPIASGGLVLILLVYLLIEREDVRDRLLRLIGQGHMSLTTTALNDAGRRISRYLLAQFAINASFGLVIGIGLMLIGLPHALLWGILAAFLRYVPIVGPWIAAVMPLSLALLTADGWLQPMMVVVLFIAFELISNLLIEPWLYGHTMGVSQASLLVAIAFWTWLWGAMGLVLAAPLTVCLVIMGKYVPALKFFDILLGDEPPLSADLRFYQRLLAHDQDEAWRVARDQLKTLPLQAVYDELMIPALTYVHRDVDLGRLSPDDAEQIWNMSSEIAEELGLLSANGQDQPAESRTSTGSGSADARVRILACAARDQADDVAVGMFYRLLDPAVCDAAVASTDRLAGEIVDQVEQEQPAIVCVVSLPPGGLSHTRLLCKRLRRHFPHLKILVGRWGLTEEAKSNREELIAAGADLIGTTLEETTSQLVQLVQYLRPAPHQETGNSLQEESVLEAVSKPA